MTKITHDGLLAENEELRRRLEEVEATVEAIKKGEVDAVVVYGPSGETVHTFDGANRLNQRLIESVHQGAVTLNDRGTILYCNRCMVDQLLRSPESLIGSPLLAFLDETDQPVGERLLQETMQTGHQEGEVRFQKADGTCFPALLVLERFPLPDTLVLFAVVTDLTQQKHHEEVAATKNRLAKSQERLQMALQAACMVAWDWDLENNRIVLSDNATQVLGLPTTTILNAEEVTRLIHPDDAARHQGAVDEAIAKRGEYVCQFRLVRPDNGAVVWLEERGRAFCDGAANAYWLGGVIMDITERRATEEALRENERRFTTLAAAVPGFLFTNLPDGCSDYTSRKFYEYTGVTHGAANGQGWEEAVHPDDRAGAAAHFSSCVRKIKTFELEYRFRSADGCYRWFLARSVPLLDEQGQVVKWYGICTDIDNQKRAEAQLQELNATLEQRVEERSKALREQEEKFRSAFDHAPIGMALVAPNGKWLLVNQALCAIVGYTESELLSTDFQTITHPDDLEADLSQTRELVAGTIKTYQMEKRYFHKKGHVVHILLAVSLVRDSEGEPLYFIGQIEDITQRKETDERIRASLREKEVLLKEIHHRVKNNLQVISSLLYLQSQHAPDQATVEMFRESQHRILSMALVHERLYRSKKLAQVDFKDYIQTLASYLFVSYQEDTNRISLEVEVDEVRLPIDTALPCGLILNELISNCLKHAFKGRERGRIRIELLPVIEGEILLCVSDDGVGLPPSLDPATPKTFGMELIAALVDQLHGNVSVHREAGATFRIVFPLAK